ncbi:MAG: GYD domain-containing protein [Desulfosarcinaceae bacterium]|nr:GYD domain-containing protein [Desulfosarcinaceae bacterium]
MLWVSYGKLSNEGLKGLVSEPQDRAEAVARLVNALGGEMISYHMLLNGDIDFIIVSEMPDDRVKDRILVDALVVRSAGGVESVTTVPALQAQDAMPQMQKAKDLLAAMAYRTPAQT